MVSMDIPDEAVEAAREQLEEMGTHLSPKYARWALAAALPFLLSHERQLTADAHRDAIANRDTVDVLERQLADVWDEGEQAGRKNKLAEEYPSQGPATTNPYRSQA